MSARMFLFVGLAVATALLCAAAPQAEQDDGPRIRLPDSLTAKKPAPQQEPLPPPSSSTSSPLTQPAAKPSTQTDKAEPAVAGETRPPTTEGDLYDLAKGLFDAWAPEEIREQYDFPSRAAWDVFVPKLRAALDGDSLEALAACEPEARSVLAALRLWPEAAPYADWLEERLAMIEVAGILSRSTSRERSTAPSQPRPSPDKSQTIQPGASKSRPPASAPLASAPYAATAPRSASYRLEAALPGYTVWLEKIRTRPAPPHAAQWLPVVQRAFASATLPPSLAWLAEVESSFNPAARSPAGAVGLYQLMAPTAKSLGLSTWMPDERLQPDPAARAAARLLFHLNSKFGDWPLAIAAYNAGEGKIRRLTAGETTASTFAKIKNRLPVETQLYVPRVYATLSVRNGSIPSPILPRQ